MVQRHQPFRPRTEQATRDASGFIPVGLVRAARGVRGELRVQRLTDVEDRFKVGATLHIDGVSYTVARSREDRHGLLLGLQGVTDRTNAEELVGKEIAIPESESGPLPEGTYYRHDIIGLRVRDAAGAELGQVQEIIETGANDVYVVRDQSGETLIPALDSIVKSVDVAAGEMLVELVPGLERRDLSGRQPSKPIQTRSQSNR